nr:reverse transcriptase domain-containing protein [Tanacetum cinerariifolium]
MHTRNSYFPNNSSITILRRRNKRRTPNIVKPELCTIVEMADNRTMEELLQAPTEGYGKAIVISEINDDHFEIKTNLLQLVQGNPYHGFERENPHTHINNFKRITSTLKFRDVPNDVIKLMMFSYSLEGNAIVWENASKTDDRIDKLADQISTLVDIFAKKVVTPAPVKAVEESCVTCGGAHAYYNCPNTDSNQPSICVATGTYNQVAPKNRASNFMAPLGFAPNQSSTSATLSSNTIPNPKGEMKAITTQSGVAYEGPSIPTPKKVVERETEEITNKEQTNFLGSTAHIQPPVTPILEPDLPNTLPKINIPYPLRLNDQKLREKATNQMEKFFQIFQDLHFDINFTDALLLMPKFTSTIKSLLTNKDKLFELAKIPLNENCSVMLLKKLPEKLGDHGKFLIPCDFPRIDVCYALADLGASINLMPLSIWKKLSLPELTPTRMTLELADRSITRPKGVVEDVFVKVGKFHFLTDFVVVDFEADPRVPLILGRSFLRTGRALIDVYEEEITLRVNDKDVTFNLYQTTRYSSTYDDLSVNRIDIIDVAREEYAQEILGFSNNSLGGNLTSTFEHILSDSSPSLTSFEGSDFILEEIDAYLKDESVSLKIIHADCDPEGDICLIEKSLNNDPFQLPPMDLKQGEVVKAKSSTEEPPELEYPFGSGRIIGLCMRTRNSYFSNNSSVTILRHRNKRRTPNIVEPEFHTIVEVAPMVDNRTTEELLQAPTEGYEEGIVIPEINADHFEIKTNLLQLVQTNPYHGFERENPDTHINNFKMITSSLKFRDVPNDVIKLMMFPYLLEGSARVWYDKEPPDSVLTWEYLIRGDIWRGMGTIKQMLTACPHHGFTELTQIDTFYNGLNENDQYFLNVAAGENLLNSLNAVAGGNLLSKTTREALQIIENKLKVRFSRNKPNVSRMNTTSRDNASKSDDRTDKLADQISTLVDIFAKKIVTPAPVKAIEESCVTCSGAHAYYNCPNTDSNQSSVCVATYNQVAS